MMNLVMKLLIKTMILIKNLKLPSNNLMFEHFVKKLFKKITLEIKLAQQFSVKSVMKY